MTLCARTTRGLAALLLSTALATPLWAQGRTEILLRTGDPAPGVPGSEVREMRALHLNDAGQRASYNVLQSAPGVLWVDDTAVFRMGDEPQDIPGGRFNGISWITMNGAGDVGYVGNLAVGEGGVTAADSSGLWRNQTLLLRRGDIAPGTDGERFDSFSALRLADDGRPVFLGRLQPEVPGPGVVGNRGLWIGDTLVAREMATLVPSSDAMIEALLNVQVNGLGQLAYRAWLVAADPADTQFTGRLGILRDGQLIRRTLDAAPGTNGAVFGDLGPPTMSNTAIAHWARVFGGDTTPENRFGIWHGDRLVVRSGDEPLAGSVGAQFANFSQIAINDWGLTAFRGELTTGLGGVTEANATGIWLYGDNGEAVQVAQAGDILDGRTLRSLSYYAQEALTNFGQLGFQAEFTDDTEALLLYTPEMAWRSPGSGAWHDRANWTLGLPPGAPHDVTIAPEGDVVVGGVLGDSRIRSLTLGGGPGLATLSPDGGRLEVLEGFDIGENARLAGSAELVGAIRNSGVITARALGLDGSIENLGTIRGATGPEDRLGGTILNTEGGLIDVRAGEGLTLEGAVESLGETRVIGGRLESRGAFANTGTVNARDATLDFAGGLENTGRVQLSLGTTDIFGDVDNAAAGQIIQSGGGAVTFWDDMKNNGEIRLSEGGTAVLFGDLFGAGSFTGPGSVFLEGGTFSPGTSPGVMTFAGDFDMTLAGGSDIFIGGLGRGTQYSGADVGGTLTLGGSLSVELGGGFLPGDGSVFELFNAGSIVGTFDDLLLPGLGGAEWDVIQSDTLFSLAVRGDAGPGGPGIGVIPLPAGGWLLLSAFGLLGLIRRRRPA